MSDFRRVIADIVPIEAATWTDEQWEERDAIVAAEVARREQIDRTAQADVAMERLGWPRRAIRAAMSADVKRAACSRINGVNFDQTNVMVLSGLPGCGKTVAAARWSMSRPHFATFLRASTFAASSRYSIEQRKVWFEATALVLDDLGSEFVDSAGSFLVDLDELIDTYYGAMRPLVITTNILSTKKFEERYGARVTDRLRECAVWFTVQDESMRRKA